MPRSRLLLAGCGHAHLFVLEALARGRLADVDATLVSPDPEYFYSGMIPGVVANCYRPEEARFRPPILARTAGARWVEGHVERIDADRRRVVLADGAELGYDVLSLDIGAGMAGDDVPGVREHAVPVKPMRQALGIVSRTEAAVGAATPTDPAQIVVVGGGAAGVEMSICLDARLTARFPERRHRITVLEAGDRILTEHPTAFRTRAVELLGARGIVVHTGVRVQETGRDAVLTGGTGSFPHHAVLWATGPRAPHLFRTSGMATGKRGYLLVHSTLQSTEHPNIFGAGDCVTFDEHPWVPRAGVYAVRDGPVLAANLERHLQGRPLERYEPQRHWLSLMNTGDRRAFVHYRGYAGRARSVWWLKDWIDRRFMRRFQRLERGG
jgi:pyridine nucleotide-disulfide oxidoreductase family protein